MGGRINHQQPTITPIINTMKRINYKSDFELVVAMNDQNGERVPFTAYDFRAKVYTRLSEKPFTATHQASKYGDIWTHCQPTDDNQLRIICDNHGLSKGKLLLEIEADLPDKSFEDGRRTIVDTQVLDITLGDESDELTTAEVELRAPFLVLRDNTPAQPAPPTIGGAKRTRRLN